jgi:glycosyltransferase involved in cell wall biosynthesis
MPSLEEAFGQTALESLACGTPVVAFAAGGIPDSVRHEQTGLLAPVGDASALRAGIERLLSDRQAWDRLSHQARQMVVAEFSLELNARRYLQLYQTMLSNGAARQTA